MIMTAVYTVIARGIWWSNTEEISWSNASVQQVRGVTLSNIRSVASDIYSQDGVLKILKLAKLTTCTVRPNKNTIHIVLIVATQ